MIKLILGAHATRFPKEIDAMFRCRARTFSERLGWAVVVKDGYERDRFDDENPLYLVSVDPDSGEYWGSLRLLPTTGPNMLRDVFPFLLSDGEVIESALIWETSRICAVPVDGQPERARGGVNQVLVELLAGIGEVAAITGLSHIVAVFDARIYRVLRATGCNPEIIGRPQRVGDTMTYVGLFETGDAFRSAFCTGQGIEGSVLAPDAKTQFPTPIACSVVEIHNPLRCIPKAGFQTAATSIDPTRLDRSFLPPAPRRPAHRRHQEAVRLP